MGQCFVSGGGEGAQIHVCLGGMSCGPVTMVNKTHDDLDGSEHGKLGCVYAMTVTAMSILLLKEGNYQVLVILKLEMDYVDFCFLPNKCYHVILSSCSKLLMNFQTEIS